jgi:hypothetical protein
MEIGSEKLSLWAVRKMNFVYIISLIHSKGAKTVRDTIEAKLLLNT